MASSIITQVSGRAVHVPGSDIDTDRIIPARFMKCVTFDGLGDYLFYDVRKKEDGSPTNHSLNDPRFTGASIMVAGSNFGCGSSREHAPQAIYRYGFRAIIAESFAEIFFGNCNSLGIPAVIGSHENIKLLNAAVQADPSLEVKLDVENEKVTFGTESFPITMRPSDRFALLTGTWDPLPELLGAADAVANSAAAVGYFSGPKK